jgi:alpha-amylase/alpha-mannosidase (GH57 family)
MPSGRLFHALGLHMHQPPGNLELLIESSEWEASQIIRCYERAARYALKYPNEARLHVGFSGVLLEQLRSPKIVDRYRQFIDIPAMLDAYRSARNVELIGMGYYHPIFPLIPMEDWREQLLAGRGIMEEIFGRSPRGFWPPEMAFSMEMIPALVAAGYEYVVVDSVHVSPEDGVADIYRPYLACHDGACITIVPRDRDLSNAQESGLSPGWFADEVRRKFRESPRPDEPRLATTWSDGENGGWFRQTHEESGFFGHFFAPYMEHVHSGEYPVRPVSLSEYLRENPPVGRAQVRTGAWNVGSTSGLDFSQWAGSETQRRAAEAVRHASARYWRLREGARSVTRAARLLDEARALILEAQTSCFLFWGDSWIPHLYERTRPAEKLLDQVESLLGGTAAVVATTAAGPAHSPAAAPTSLPAHPPSAPAPQKEAGARPPAVPPVTSSGKDAPAAAPPAAKAPSMKPTPPWKGRPPKGKRRR